MMGRTIHEWLTMEFDSVIECGGTRVVIGTSKAGVIWASYRNGRTENEWRAEVAKMRARFVATQTSEVKP